MAFELPRLNRFCCFSLRTGALVIGYFSIFGSIFYLSGVSWSLYTVVNFVKTHKHSNNPSHTPEEMAKTALSLYIAHAYYLLVFVYCFVISLLLVIGVHKNKPSYMRFYYRTAMFLFVLELALVVVTVVFLGFLATIPLLKWCLLIFYSMMVVKSAFLEMEEQNRPRVFEMKTIYPNPNGPPQQTPLIA